MTFTRCGSSPFGARIGTLALRPAAGRGHDEKVLAEGIWRLLSPQFLPVEKLKSCTVGPEQVFSVNIVGFCTGLPRRDKKCSLLW